MKTMILEVPQNLDLTAEEALFLVTCKLYEQGKLSVGQAADMMPLSKREYLERLGMAGVSVFQYEEGEILEYLRNARRYSR